MSNNSNVIDSLLVRLGLDVDKKEFDQARILFSGVKDAALQFGAIIGGSLGLKSLTFGFKDAINEMTNFGKVYGVTAQFVSNLSSAFQKFGGSSEDAYGSIRHITDLMRQTEWGEIPEQAFRVPGFNPMLLEGSQTVGESIERLTQSAQGMDQQNLLRAFGALGFSEAEMRAFQSGNLDKYLKQAEGYKRVTPTMSMNAAKFNDSVVNLGDSGEGLRNEIGSLLTAELTQPIQDLADYMRDNRNELVDFFKTALPYLEATAIGVAGLLALQAGQKAVGLVGGLMQSVIMPTLGGSAALAGILGYAYYKDDPEGFKQSWEVQKQKFTELPESFSSLEDFPLPLPNWLRHLNKDSDTRGLGGSRGSIDRSSVDGSDIPDIDTSGAFNKDSESYSMPPPAPPPPANPKPTPLNTVINIDARHSVDPAATEAAVRRSVQELIIQNVSNSIQDLRSPVK